MKSRRVDPEDDGSRASVVRQLLRVGRRPPKAGSEPQCLDPKSISPEPLAFLLREQRTGFCFGNPEWPKSEAARRWCSTIVRHSRCADPYRDQGLPSRSTCRGERRGASGWTQHARRPAARREHRGGDRRTRSARAAKGGWGLHVTVERATARSAISRHVRGARRNALLPTRVGIGHRDPLTGVQRSGLRSVPELQAVLDGHSSIA